MFMLMLYRYITGYVKFYGTGVFPERFLNLCAKDNIIIWSPRINYGNISGCMRVKDYKKIRKYARKSNMRLKVRKKVGVVFIINRYRHRYGIAVGAVLFFFIIWFLSGFCFNISVCGNENLSETKILNMLDKQGVYIGRKISSIDTEKTRQLLLLKNKELAWAAINIDGSFITVDVRETTEKKMNITSDEPCNVVATYPGKILRIKAYQGSISTMVNTNVTKGDLLVSGVIELANKSTKFVSANAEVIAQTKHEIKVFVPYRQTIYIKTGKKITHSVLNFMGIEIPLFLGQVKEPYIANRNVKNYEIDGVKLPIKMTTADFFTTTRKKVTVTQEQAKSLAKQKVLKKANKKLSKIMKDSKKGKFTVTSDGVMLTKIYICEENIATTKKILK